MHPRPDNSKHPQTQRSVIFFGETGAGKSSAINLLGANTLAPVSSDSHPCTQTSSRYETTLNGIKCILWDTGGLGEGRGWLQYFFGGGSEKKLKTFLKERHQNNEIDLLVYCVRGSRATRASVNYYNTFCTVTRRLAAPVAILVTQLEKEMDMEDWWSKNSSSFAELGMVFDDHACITTLPGHPRRAECKRMLADLITRNRRWQVKESGSYFGSAAQKSSAAARKGWLGQSIFKTSRASVDGEDLTRYPSNDTGKTPSPASSVTGSSYHTADSHTESTPPSPLVETPTPRSATTPIKVLRNIDTNPLGFIDQPEPSSEETFTTKSSLDSMFHPSSHSSHTSHSEVNLESCVGEKKDCHLDELPFKHSTIRRRQPYAILSGGFGDIWQCDLTSGESSRMVAVKAVRTSNNGLEDSRSLEKKLRRELKVWEKLQHRNVVPLLGVVSGFGRLSSPVSPWFHNGSLSHYMAHHQISMSRKHRLLGDIAVGLRYLHSQGVVHGDLHSDNVLIDDDGTGCLTDFGLSFIDDFVGTSYLKSAICGLVPFADPALVQRAYTSQDASHPTKPCDIYSFGGLMLHVLSGVKPYDGIPSPIVIVTIMNGERPRIPTHEHIARWHKSLIQLCWHPEERKRPSADGLIKKFDRR